MVENRVVERALASKLAALSEQIRPGALAHERTVALSECFEGLFPAGLQRGATVAIGGPATISLALALAVGPSQAGGWVITLGLQSLGLAAACEHGLALDRLILVGAPPPRLWPDVVVTAAEGAEVVLAMVPGELRAADARRVQARLARSNSVLVLLGGDGVAGLQPDVRIVTSHPRWEGIEQGSGRLLARRVDVSVEGRRAVRPRRRTLLLPDPAGRADLAPSPAMVGAGDVRMGDVRMGDMDDMGDVGDVAPLRNVG
jgi:hypothetical protein